MPNKDLVEIVIVLDRSGSMADIRQDMEGGFQTFLTEQRAQPGKAVISLYQFDTEYNVVYEEKPVTDGLSLNITPRGSTALLDAVGKTITLVGERLARKPEAERPGGVLFLVITDGQDNSSREFKKDRVLEMVKHQFEVYKWQFIYLGSDLSTAADASDIGMSSQGYAATADGVKGLYGGTSKTAARYRASVRSGSAFDPNDASGN